jgi:hypothetical protein
MKINIAHVGSNNWFNYKSDIIYGLFHTFNKLGHITTITNNSLSKHAHNLIVGADWLTSDKELSFIFKENYEYSIYDVENFDGKTINNRSDFNIQNYIDLLGKAKYILTPYKHNFIAYDLCNFMNKAIYSPWGFYDEIVNPLINNNYFKHIDALFFGLLKGSRKNTIDKLSASLVIKAVDNNEPHDIKAYYLSTSKFSLSLRSGSSEVFVNPFRILYCVANGIPVISDNKNDLDGYLNYTINTNLETIEDFKHIKAPSSSELSDISRQYPLSQSFSHFF